MMKDADACVDATLSLSACSQLVGLGLVACCRSEHIVVGTP